MALALISAEREYHWSSHPGFDCPHLHAILQFKKETVDRNSPVLGLASKQTNPEALSASESGGGKYLGFGGNVSVNFHG